MNLRDLSLALTPPGDGPPTPYLQTAVVVSTGATWTVTLDGVNVTANALNNLVASVGDIVNVITTVGAPPLVLGVSGKPGVMGFEVYRSTNAAAIASPGGSSLITFDTVTYESSTDWVTGATFDTATVPAGAAGLYVGELNVLFGGAVGTATPGVLVAIAVNGTAVVGGQCIGPKDRVFCSGSFRLAVGDAVRARITNFSGASVTPTASAPDAQTPRMLFLSVHRAA